MFAKINQNDFHLPHTAALKGYKTTVCEILNSRTMVWVVTVQQGLDYHTLATSLGIFHKP